MLIERFSVGLVSAARMTRWNRFRAALILFEKSEKRSCSGSRAVIPIFNVSQLLIATHAVVIACRLESGR